MGKIYDFANFSMYRWAKYAKQHISRTTDCVYGLFMY